MSGLDDSLSDVGAKKKYPFELEKAIHNVMFIQHHMQRQDEFNAVSGTEHGTQFHVLLSLSSFDLSIRIVGISIAVYKAAAEYISWLFMQPPFMIKASVKFSISFPSL